jgi:hypothetical protein
MPKVGLKGRLRVSFPLFKAFHKFSLSTPCALFFRIAFESSDFHKDHVSSFPVSPTCRLWQIQGRLFPLEYFSIGIIRVFISVQISGDKQTNKQCLLEFFVMKRPIAAYITGLQTLS